MTYSINVNNIILDQLPYIHKTPSGSTNTNSNISINVNGNVLYTNTYYQLGQVPYTIVNLPMSVQYISRLNTSDITEVGYYVGDGFVFPISNLLIAYCTIK